MGLRSDVPPDYDGLCLLLLTVHKVHQLLTGFNQMESELNITSNTVNVIHDLCFSLGINISELFDTDTYKDPSNNATHF